MKGTTARGSGRRHRWSDVSVGPFGRTQTCADCGAVKGRFAARAALVHGVNTEGRASVLYRSAGAWSESVPRCCPASMESSADADVRADVIWRKECGDGSRLEVPRMYRQSRGYREEHEFPLFRVRPDGSREAVCVLGEDGLPRRWYIEDGKREEAESLMEGLPEALLVEVVSES